MRKMLQKRGGFTLLELLVVISIIGILMALGVVAFSTAQSKGRDAKRRGDMQAIQDAQEQYYAANSGSYAETVGALVSGEYLQAEPQDPQNSQGKNYAYDLNPGDYCVCADVEGDDGNSSDNGCTWTSGDGDYFCTANLQ